VDDLSDRILAELALYPPSVERATEALGIADRDSTAEPVRTGLLRRHRTSVIVNKQGIVWLAMSRSRRDPGLHREREPEPPQHRLDEPLLRLTLVGVLESGPLGLP
jgi:hypothetical protein